MEHSVAPSSPQNTLTRKIFLKIYIKHTQSSHVRRVLAQYFLHSIPFLWSKSIRNTSWGCNFKQRYFKITRGGRVRLSTSHPSKRATSEVFLGWFLPWKQAFLSIRESQAESATGSLRPSLPTISSFLLPTPFFWLEVRKLKPYWCGMLMWWEWEDHLGSMKGESALCTQVYWNVPSIEIKEKDQIEMLLKYVSYSFEIC